jgi:hypothetical protein
MMYYLPMVLIVYFRDEDKLAFLSELGFFLRSFCYLVIYYDLSRVLPLTNKNTNALTQLGETFLQLSPSFDGRVERVDGRMKRWQMFGTVMFVLCVATTAQKTALEVADVYVGRPNENFRKWSFASREDASWAIIASFYVASMANMTYVVMLWFVLSCWIVSLVFGATIAGAVVSNMVAAVRAPRTATCSDEEWFTNIQVPLRNLTLLTTQALSRWGFGLGATFIGYFLCNACAFPSIFLSRDLAWASSKLVEEVTWVVAILPPIILAAIPASISTQCGTMVKELWLLCFDGDGATLMRVERIQTILDRVGFGFRIGGILVDLSLLKRFVFVLFSSAGTWWAYINGLTHVNHDAQGSTSS